MSNNQSTGPITETGKFESSKNALTHGLTASNIDRFSATTREAFSAYLAQQYEEWKPATLNEKTYLERYAFNQFQLLRSESLVDNATEALLADPENEKAIKRHQTFTRHLRALERSSRETLRELRRMISDRLVETAEALSEGIEPLAVMTPHHLLKKALPQPQAAPPSEDSLRFVDEMPPLARMYANSLLEKPSRRSSRDQDQN